MNIKDRVEKLEDKFDSFVHDFYDELKDLKEEVKEGHLTAYQRICKIVRDVKLNKREIIRLTISKDIERELRTNFPVGSEPSYGITTILGIPVEIDLTCHNTITATIE